MTKYAKTYAGALYDLAKEEGQELEILSDFERICAVLKEMPEYRKLLSTPAVSKEERKALIKEAWQGSISQYTMNFINILCDNDGISELSDCALEFRNRYNKDKGIVEATVTSAVALRKDQRDALVAAIEKKTGKKVILLEKTDPKIIGGLKLNVEGTQYDGSVAHHLDSISDLLSGN